MHCGNVSHEATKARRRRGGLAAQVLPFASFLAYVLDIMGGERLLDLRAGHYVLSGGAQRALCRTNGNRLRRTQRWHAKTACA